jgi:hypothetical protein
MNIDNLDQIKKDILDWMEGFVEHPHPALGGWPPCPFARKARLDNAYEVVVGDTPFKDLVDFTFYGMNGKDVVILAYDPASWDYQDFHDQINAANIDHLLPNDIIALEDHPGAPEIVNGVSMNQGKYALSLVQSLSDLDQRAQQMANKGFYHGWPEDYLTGLFEHRRDPR